MTAALLSSTVVLLGGRAGTAAAPTMAQIQGLLVEHGRALLNHSQKAFLAGIDSDPAAKIYRSAQSAMIDNIGDVPLASWSYEVTAPVTSLSATAAASSKYGRPTVILQVSFSYELAGVDTLPSTHPLWLTFVQRNGQAYIAGDDDMAAFGSRSWRGIWDFGPVEVARGAFSLVLGQVGGPADLISIASTVDAAIPAVDTVWGRHWGRTVAVLVPATEAELTTLLGDSAAVSDVAAVAVTEGIDPLSTRPYGQRLLIAPRALTKLGAISLQVLRHEITHLATAAVTSDLTPHWLVEGFADYVGNLDDSRPARSIAGELVEAIARGAFPSALPTDAALTPTAVGAAAAYEQAWLACRYLAERYGQAELVRFYRAVATAVSTGPAAVVSGMTAVLHTSLAAFTAAWRSYLQRQLGS